MPEYLTEREGTFYFRRPVPKDVRAVLGRAQWMFTLKTKNRKEGERLARLEAVLCDEMIEDARRALIAAPTTSTEPPIAKYDPFPTEAHFDHFVEAQELNAEWEAELESNPVSHQIDLAVERALAQVREANSHWAQVIAKEARQSNYPSNNVTGSSLTPPSSSTVAQTASPALFDALIDKWAAERKPQQKTIDAHRAVGRWLYERVGEVPVAEINRKHVLAFKDKMLSEGVTVPNIKTKLSKLRTLLRFAHENDLAPVNAAAGVTIIDTDQGKRKRQPFRLDALNTIFQSPVYANDERPSGGRGEAAYWLPLLALYTGARLEELAQLRPHDVSSVRYLGPDDSSREAWMLHITEDEEDGLKVKNARSIRDVPVHPTLIELGFIRFVDNAKIAKDERLFPDLKPNVYGRFSAKWGEWFGSYLREVCGITDPRLVFHSFRHSWKQYARDTSIVEGVQRQIMGHSSSDVADSYGNGYSAHQIVEGMKQYRIPGFKPPPPPLAFRLNADA